MTLASIGGAFLGGCASVGVPQRDRLAHASAPAAIPASAWPDRSSARITQAVEDLGTLPTVLSVPSAHRVVVDGKPVIDTVALPVMELSDAGAYGRGMVFRMQKVSARTGEPVVEDGLSMKFLTFPVRPGERRPRVDATQLIAAGGAVSTVSVDSPDPGTTPRRHFRPDPWALAQRGIWLRLFLPEAPEGGDTAPTPRGLVVHLCSFGGGQFEQPVIDSLLAEGWAVLRVASPNLRPNRGTPDLAIDSDDDLDRAARNIANHVDDRLAEHAYAVEAALAYIADRHPEITTAPLVLMGYSAGALVAPVVAARLPDRFDAAVLVCGGANLFDISQRSELTDGGIKIKWGPGRGTPDDVQRLSSLYLAYSRLDPFHTAAYLNSVPVLQVHGTADGIVPSDDGDILYERLNRPEKIAFPLGHKAIFFLLPTQAHRLVDWVDQTVPSQLLSNRLANRGPTGHATASESLISDTRQPPRSVVP